MTVSPAPDDIVATRAEAERNERVPLLVLEPLAAFLDEHGLGSGAARGRAGRRGPLERDVPRPPRRHRGRRPPPAAPAAAAERPRRRCARRGCSRAIQGTAARVPEVLARLRRRGVIGAPFYVMERVHGEVITSEVPAALDTPERAPAHRRAARRRAGRDPRRRLAALPRGLRQADRLPRAPGPPLRRPVGAQPTREVEAVERVGAWLRRAPARVRPGDDRPRRLPPRQRDVRRRRRRRACCAVFDWEMATIGDPLADVGYLCATWSEADDPPVGTFELGRVTRADGLPDARRAHRPLRGALGRARSATWPGTRRSRSGSPSCSWRATTAARVEGRTDDPYLKSLRRGRDRARRPAPRRSRSARTDAATALRAAAAGACRADMSFLRTSSSFARFFGSDAKRLALSVSSLPCLLLAKLLMRFMRNGTPLNLPCQPADDPRSIRAAQLGPAAGRDGARRAAPRELDAARPGARSSSSWRSSPSRALRRNSQPNRQIVRIEPSTIMIEPAAIWSPAARSRARARPRRRRRRRGLRPDEDVREDRRRQPHGDDVDELRERCRTTPAWAAGRAAPSTC